MNYELLILVPGLVNDAAAERSLDSIAQLQPQPTRITVVDWSHDVHPDLRTTGTNRHGLARCRSGALDDLLELADEVWSENLIPHKRVDPVGPESFCCQCRTKAWAIGEARARGMSRILYMQFGGRLTATAPQAMLATLDADAEATFAFCQVYRCSWSGQLSTPPQFIHQEQVIREVTARHKFMPGMMVAVDRLVDTALLDDRSDWPNLSDDLITRQLLLTNGHGIGVPRSESEHLYYYHADENPLTKIVRGQYTRSKAGGRPGDPQAGRPLLMNLLRESDADHTKLLATRKVADREALRQQRAALGGVFQLLREKTDGAMV